MTAPRVLFVDHAGVLGGAELSLLDIVDAFRPGAAVMLLADGPFRAELQARGVPVEVIPLRAAAAVRKATRFPSPLALLDVVRVARGVARRAAPFDVIHANSQKAFVVVAVAGWMAGKPVVWHLRDILGAPHFSATNSRMVARLANAAARTVICNSHATAAAFVASGGRRDLVRVVHNGISAVAFDAVTDATAGGLRRTLAPDGAPVVVHVGRFHPWKGQQVLLRAMPLLPGVHAWFVGAPLFGEEAFAAELRAMAARLGVADRVRFLEFRDDVPALLAAADVVAHTSVYPEPFGRVIVEGMLAGKPVVAADAGGAREIVANGDTGLLVPPDDPETLAGALARLIRDPAGAAAMGARGRAHARAAFSREAMVGGVRAAMDAAVAR